jgi:hypothetical protein
MQGGLLTTKHQRMPLAGSKLLAGDGATEKLVHKPSWPSQDLIG